MNQYQPLDPQHTQPHRSWPARHKALTAILGVVGLFVLIGVIGAATGGGGSAETAPQPAPTVTVTQAAPAVTVTDATTPRPVTSSPAAPSPEPTHAAPVARTVATFSGSGQQNTPKFTVTSTWKLKYSFDCSGFGYKGNFQVYEDGGFTGLSVNDLAMAKSASTYAYNDAGTHYLQVNSECSWTMTVVDEPGQ